MAVPPVLLEVVRGGVVESHHRVSLVLLDAAGGVELALGDPDAVIYPRSALKPLQAVAMLTAGFAPGEPARLALAAASHGGQPIHLEGVRTILGDAGLDPAALRCPSDLPAHPPSQRAWLRAGRDAAPLCHNCSGKHAAMLAACVAGGWDTGAYLELDHPLQQAIAATVERLAGARIEGTAVDGCGAPAHRLPLVAMARAFRGLVGAPSGSPERRVADAMRADPGLVAWDGHPTTELMTAVPGLLAKNGAEGVWAAALPDGRAFAAKVDDGAGRALGPLLSAVLTYWGASGPVIERWAEREGVRAAAPSELSAPGHA